MARPRRADILFAFDLLRKPVPTFRDHALTPLLPLLVALLILVIGRIEAGQLGALFHFLHQPAFHELVLGAFAGDKIRKRGRDHQCAVVVGDDGAVVIPAALADFVASEGAEHELMESWLVQEVEKGAKLPGLYPPNDENKKRYEEWKKKH